MVKWLLLFLFCFPAFADEGCNCTEPDWDTMASKAQASHRNFLRGTLDSSLDGKTVCLEDKVVTITGMDGETGQFMGKQEGAELVWSFSRNDFYYPITRGQDENFQSKYECQMSELVKKSQEQRLKEEAATQEAMLKEFEDRARVWEEEKKRRCEVEPHNYPDDCQKDEEQEDERTESSSEDEGETEQTSGNEAGPGNHKD